MSPAELETMRSVEDHFWWYRALRQHVLNSIDPPGAAFTLLDVGCGTGGMLSRIHDRFPSASLTALDFSERALEASRLRNTGAALVQARADDIPFADSQFDVVVSLDVILMKGVDDREAIRHMHRVLRPGGRVILNVAAFDFLRGSHDVAVNLARRYTRPQIARLLQQAGFTIQTLTYWNMTLLPAVAAVRWASRGNAHRADVRSDLTPLWRPLNAALTGIAQIELASSRIVPLPWGTSVFAVARK